MMGILPNAKPPHQPPPLPPQYDALILTKLEEILAELKWMHRDDPRPKNKP